MQPLLISRKQLRLATQSQQSGQDENNNGHRQNGSVHDSISARRGNSRCRITAVDRGLHRLKASSHFGYLLEEFEAIVPQLRTFVNL